MSVELKSAKDLEGMRRVGRLHAEVRALLMDASVPG
jgi:methionine aminopeptidase